ncbi:MAG: DUF4388 domain-containing protein [Candidatus Sabulitectum sp.]|nr:DUF4388 domain-containing protein [Candidatus Sabulitectum sp.]
MAFNGNLSEFGVVALLQLPGTNHLTGKLALSRKGETAEFYYKSGKLVHASLGDILGTEVLVKVIDWVDGDFIFDSTSITTEKTIKQDLQNTLMRALKERDERKKKKQDEEKEAARKLAEIEKAEKELAAKKLAVQEQTRQLLDAEKLDDTERSAEVAVEKDLPEPVLLPHSLMQGFSSILISYLINSRGQVIAMAEAEPDFLKKVNPFLTALKSFIRDYPGRVVGKTFIEDSEFTVALVGISETLISAIFVSTNTRLGLLSIELNKFVRALQQSKLEILND